MREIKLHIESWKFSSFRERWKEVIMTRIWIGHTKFMPIYLMGKTKPAKCKSCKTQMTVKHIIIGECPFFNLIRRRNFKNANNFKDIMDEGN